MPTLIRCVCGKRYKIPESAPRKPIRCKECGEELPLPDAAIDDDLDMVDDDTADEDNEYASPRRPRRGKKKSSRRRSADSGSMINGDMLVRGAGLSVFLATLVYAIHRYVFYEWPDNIPVPVRIIAVCWPMFIFGFIGLYIAYIGEEPDKVACRENRMRGLLKCGAGVGLIVLGVALTFLVAMAKIGVIFTGLIGGGVLFIIFGFLGALTGRDFKHRGYR